MFKPKFKKGQLVRIVNCDPTVNRNDWIGRVFIIEYVIEEDRHNSYYAQGWGYWSENNLRSFCPFRDAIRDAIKEKKDD